MQPLSFFETLTEMFLSKRGDAGVIECSNMFEGLSVHGSGSRTFEYLNPPTPCIYKKRRSSINKQKHINRSRKNKILSRWQESLVDSQSLSIETTHRRRTSLSKHRRLRRKFSDMSEKGYWRTSDESSDEEDIEMIFQTSAIHHKEMRKICTKLPFNALLDIYEGLEGPWDMDEDRSYYTNVLKDMIDNETQRRQKANKARFTRRCKCMLRHWSDHHIKNQLKKIRFYKTLSHIYNNRHLAVLSFEEITVKDYYDFMSEMYPGYFKYITTYHDDRVISSLENGDDDEMMDFDCIISTKEYQGTYNPITQDRIMDTQSNCEMDTQSNDVMRSIFKTRAETLLMGMFGTTDINNSKIMYHLERILDTLLTMYNAKNWIWALYQIKIYLTNTFEISLAYKVYDYIMSLFDNSDEINVQNAATDDTNFSFKSIFGEWKGIMYGEFLQKVIKAIACLVSLGFCSVSSIPFCNENFERFYKGSKYEQKSWPDLITCIFDTILYVFEKSSNWFTGKCKFLDIIRSPSSAYEYDKEFAYLSANIGLYELNELDKLGIQRHEYECRLEDMMNKTKSFYEKSSGAERRVLSLNMRELERLQVKVLCSTQAMSLREAPFAFFIYGKSGVGKTAMTNIIINALLRSNDLNPDKKYICSINASDAYQSELQPWHSVVFCDDLSNTKATHELGCSTQLIIDYVNNNPKCALKADVDSKGKVLIKPKVFCATTNVKDVEAHVKSNEPLSILRRLNICITMVVKPEYCKQGSHFLDPTKMTAAINNAWLFKLEECVPIPSDATSTAASNHKWSILKWNNEPLENVDINKVIQYLVFRSRLHFTQQAQLLASIDDIHASELCVHNSYASTCHECQNIIINTQSNDEYGNDTDKKAKFISLSKVSRVWFWLYDITPYSFTNNKYVDNLYNVYVGTDEVERARKKFNFLSALAISSTYIMFGLYGQPFMFMFGWAITTYAMCMYAFMIYYIKNLLLDVREKSMTCIQPIVNNKYKVIAGLSVAVLIVKIVRRLRPAIPLVNNMFDVQGSAYVTPKPDVVQRENVWLKPYVETKPTTMEVATATCDQVTAVIKDNIASVTFRYDNDEDKVRSPCCAFPLKGNTWIVPYHVVRRDFNYVEIKRKPGFINNNRTCRIQRSSWIRIGETDLALITLPSAGDNRDLTHYFSNNKSFDDQPVKWIYKDNDCNTAIHEFVAEFKFIDFTTPLGQRYAYQGWEYDLPIHTRNGFCMATMISKGKFPYILGFHSAGAAGTGHSYGHYVTKDELDIHIDKLYNHVVGDSGNINIQCHSTGNMVLDFPKYDIKHLGEIHPKSPFNYFTEPACVLLYGAHSGNRRRFKSDVIPTYISDSVTRHLGIPRKHGPPKNIANWIPWQTDARAVSDVVEMNLEILSEANADFERHIFDFLNQNEHYKDVICPMSRAATLAGVDGCRGIDAIKLSTSAGYPRCKPKSHYVFESDEEEENITRPLDVSQEIWDEVERLEDVLASGSRVYFIHRINLKDEPTKLEKEKVRTFAGCTLECLILIRMYFLPIAKMIMDNSTLFECAVGVNAHGPEWTILTNHMQKYGPERTVAGDYKAYDSKMWCYLVLLAFNILIEIAKWAGYNERQIQIMKGLATELTYGLTEYNGEYAMWLAQNLSGHGLTVFINNIVNSLYMRYTYYDIITALEFDNKLWLRGLYEFSGLDNSSFSAMMADFVTNIKGRVPPQFATVVSLICYGDDNKMSVKQGYSFYNHNTISYSLSRYGVTYTMADKESKSVPYIHATECSFLKRYSVWDDNFKQYLAPLELDSLVKTLHACITSKVLTHKQQSVEALDSVVRELFYHGETVFNSWRDKLELVVYECGLNSYLKTGHLHTYQFLRQEYVNKYLSDSDIKNNQASTPIDEIAKNGHTIMDTQCNVSRDMISNHKALLYVGDVCYLAQSSPAQKYHPHFGHNLKQGVVSVQIATNTQDKVNVVSSMMGPQTHQTTTFRDGTGQWTSGIEGAYDNTRKVGMDQSLPLQDFFSRPIKFNMPEWIPGSLTPYGFTINPWKSFFENPRVSNRISNYNLLQATLKVKFMINGNSFYYGRLMADYTPLHTFNQTDYRSSLESENIVQASQRSHLLLNPTTSQGGELSLPFIWMYNALRIPNADWNDMGQIIVREMVGLKHANASDQSISISCYVWAENVVLSVPTSQPASGMIPQSKDEYGATPISDMASSIANAAGKLSSVPIIAPYAKATQMIANGAGSVAKIFGYSRPPIITEHVPMRPRFISKLAVTDIGDDVTKLTLDSKQELTIDPKVAGIDIPDELTIKSISGKESFLTTFPWVTTKTVDELLWNTRVTPNVARQQLALVNPSYVMPACNFASQPFQYWRGTMRYRFQVVCSDFHRGRLRFTYDPQVITGSEANITFSKIIDLCDETDFTMDISWGQDKTYLRVSPLSSTHVANYGTGVIASASTGLCNGVLGVYVLNDLTTPNSTVNNDIKVNVFVSMCDDVEFQSPSYFVNKFTMMPQSMDESDNVEKADDNAPVMTDSDDKIMECLVVDNTNDVYFGETITSFRSLLKRYNYYDTPSRVIVTPSFWNLTFSDFPLYRGLPPVTASAGVVMHTSSIGTFVNFTQNTILNYLTPAFLMTRGGIRWKLVYMTDGANRTNATADVTRTNPTSITDNISNTNSTAALTTTNTSQASFTFGAQTYSGGVNGKEVTVLAQQPVLEFEVPYFTDARFSLCKNIMSATSGARQHNRIHLSPPRVYTTLFNAQTAVYNQYVAAAEDFTLLLFQGCPPVAPAFTALPQA